MLSNRELPLLFCFSHLRWDFVFQRPHQLLTRAAQHFDVAYFEEPLFEQVDQPLLRSAKRGKITLLTPVLPQGVKNAELGAMLRWLVDNWLEKRTVKLLWYYTPQALAFSDHLRADVVVYDNMDELSAFLGASGQLAAWETQLLRKADIVFTGGRSLYESKKARHCAIHCFPSSIDAPHFQKARSRSVDPADQAGIPSPRIGFFGVIDERMDLDLVAAVAKLKPEWNFIMLGPICKIDPAWLPKADNLHWLGGKSYDDLPSYLGSWNAGFMPFALNDSTRFISPTKTPEFLAAGLPVVSTAIADVVRTYGENGLVEIAGTPDEFVTKLSAVLQQPREAFVDKVDAFLSSMSWDGTWTEMQSLIQATSDSRHESLPLASDVAHV
jgi:glycosyltransferase involved in cell wall biosynthesis